MWRSPSPGGCITIPLMGLALRVPVSYVSIVNVQAIQSLRAFRHSSIVYMTLLDMYSRQVFLDKILKARKGSEAPIHAP